MREPLGDKGEEEEGAKLRGREKGRDERNKSRRQPPSVMGAVFEGAPGVVFVRARN